jgi:hypothetical protein
LGRELHRDYIDNQHFLSEYYNEEEIEVFTTNFNRTFESIRSQLYGLYGLGKGADLPTVDSKYHLPPYDNQTDSS